MKTFLSIKSIYRAAHLRLAARFLGILLLAFLWPARGEAQTSSDPLDVNDLSFTGSDNSVTLTCSDQGAWTYKGGGKVSETPFNGTLTGTQANGKVFYIKSNKVVTGDTATYPKLILDDLNYTSDGAVFEASNSKPVYIQTNRASKLVSTGVGTGDAVSVINNYQTSLVIDGGSNGLEIEKNAAYDVDKLYGINNYGSSASILLQGKITIKVHNTEAGSSSAIAVILSFLSYGESANIQCLAQSGINRQGPILSPFLEWTFADAPTNGKLEIRDADGQSLDPAVEFTTDGKAKSFTVSATKNTGYTLWLSNDILSSNEQLMDAEGTTVFKATDDKLFSFSGMKTLPSNWSEYAQTAKVGPAGADVTVSDTHYTVHTPAGLAWIAWVTSNGKKSTDGQNYPTNKGFAGCTVTLDSDISLTKPEYGVTDNFYAGWPTIGYGYSSEKRFKGIFDGGNHTISDLSMTGGVADYTGLFSYIEEAVIKNLRVEGKIEVESTSNGNIRLGGIAGFASNSKIIACSNAVKITLTAPGVAGNESNIGGIVGQASSSDIRNCWNEASLSGTSENLKFNIGGIAGRSNSPIYNCYSSGDVSGTGNSSSACKSGGIVGYMEGSSTLSNCYATGSVSATNNYLSSAACAGGIVGDLDSATVSNCLALNAGDKISAKGGANGSSNKGRIVGYKGQGTISNNYASTKIMLSDGYSFTAPTENIGANSINGENIYIDDAADIIAAWTGDGTAFTAIGTDPDGKLPQLKVIASLGWDGLPSSYGNSVMEHQPSLTTSGYLGMPTALELSLNDTETITLSCTGGKWSYKKGTDGASNRFDGAIRMAQSVAESSNPLIVSATSGNETLTFEKVNIDSDGAALTIDAGCTLTINTTGDNTSTLASSAASTIANKGILTVKGKGLFIINKSATDTHYGIENSSSFTVDDPSATSVTFHCANIAIHNAGTLGNPWIEWRFAEAPAGDGKIAFAATDDADQSPAAQLCQGKSYATIVTSGKTYYLWKVTGSNGEVRTLQKGLEGSKLLYRFPAPAGQGVAVYTKVEDLKTIEIASEQDFTAQGCLNQNVIVKAGGVLTVDTASAIVLNLKLEEGGQVVTTNALKVDETFSTTRTLDNQWIAFGSPVAMKASVGEADGQLLYLGTGYTDSDPLNQCWKNVSGFPDTGKKTADLAADSPYLLAAEESSTKVTFTATAGTDMLEIPATATVTLGVDLPNGQFLFRTNPNLANLTLSNIYVLNAEGTLFELQTGSYQVKPFEAYVVANAVTCSRIRSLKIGDNIATGIDRPIAATTRIWGTRGTLHISADAPADVLIVTPAGRTLRSLKASAGETTLVLPAGIYFVRCNGITYKVSL